MKLIGYFRTRTGVTLASGTEQIQAYCKEYGHELIDCRSEAAPGLELARCIGELDEADGIICLYWSDFLIGDIFDQCAALQNFVGNVHKSELVVVTKGVDSSTKEGYEVVLVMWKSKYEERDAEFRRRNAGF